MNLIVQKYGGSSISTIEKIKNVAKKIKSKKEDNYHIIVVVSAMGNTTDKLIKLSKQISPLPDKRELDVLLSIGEQKTIALLAMALKELGLDAISLTGAQARIITEGEHTNSIIKDLDKNIILEYLQEGKVVIITGFQGVNSKGDITTLGRGGSDTSAVAIAGKLNCPCEIYTDVDGIYSIDPRLYPNARQIDYISYDMVLALSTLGAKVLEKRAVQLAKQLEVPIYLASSITGNIGTTIRGAETVEESKIVGLAVDENCAIITIESTNSNKEEIMSILNLLTHLGIDINTISISNVSNGYMSMSFMCSRDDYGIVDSIEKLICVPSKDLKITKDENSMKISLIGSGINKITDYHSILLKIFYSNNLMIKHIANSETYTSYVVDKGDKNKVISDIATEFNL
ncbi:aspartokinase II [Proteiniborus sp. DW1]|uniref:aspartate kinase n=1 Tax=Proteiniborus sp. DW1 TaxID=1889883 RepID=UPI00092E1D48|nr:aspartate kinase [Proteiniborus sp. DW1]SCG84169.1 aspartokinase II [Proteiniborus sp. DW1]